MDMKLELVALAVSDVDRAKAFYTERVGFIADHDHIVSDELRFVQLTPPGSAFGVGEEHEPPPREVLHLGDLDTAALELCAGGLDVLDDELQAVRRARRPIDDTDAEGDRAGNRWSVQQLPERGA